MEDKIIMNREKYQQLYKYMELRTNTSHSAVKKMVSFYTCFPLLKKDNIKKKTFLRLFF